MPSSGAGGFSQLNSTLVSDTTPISESAVTAAVDAAITAISASTTISELRAARAEHAGEQSTLAQFNAQLKSVAPEDRAATSKLVGQARARVAQSITEREAILAVAEENERLASEAVDVTAVATRSRTGARHPLNLLMEHMADVFVGMGWEVAEGPELENEWFNFDALNFDEDHPARAMQDTFFVDPVDKHLVLRTHTSPVQVRSLLGRPLPVYVVAPGKVFRTDELDATHTPVFHQLEGIAIDKGLTMAHLRGTLEHLARAMFGEGAEIRLRPNYFPFTEPSAEMDVWQPNAKGGARWVEWGGCGMVNPNVLLAAGIDPEEYQGFAFGMGIERTLQFRNDMNDMRDMVEGDIRFSQQFGMVV
ncbi:phenylalanine--tRNA ligase subunit alpha [soil metagenome]